SWLNGPLDAPTNTASPASATACRYDAWRPFVVHDHERPASRLQPNPRAAAATATLPLAATWCTSVSGSSDACHVSPSSSDRHTPPTWTPTSTDSAADASDHTSGAGAAGFFQPRRPGTVSNERSTLKSPPAPRRTWAPAVPTKSVPSARGSTLRRWR